MSFVAIPDYTPHRIAFGLSPSALRLPLEGLLKKSKDGDFAVIPVSEPTKAGGFDGIQADGNGKKLECGEPIRVAGFP